jgi:hemoglobin/transferrin/lactoferrin receptor protein
MSFQSRNLSRVRIYCSEVRAASKLGALNSALDRFALKSSVAYSRGDSSIAIPPRVEPSALRVDL